jgi:hypothetical protein
MHQKAKCALIARGMDLLMLHYTEIPLAFDVKRSRVR